MNAASNSETPARTVGRAFDLIRLIASSRTRSLRLVEIAALLEMDKSTAHRLLQRMVMERALVQERDRRYVLGPLLYELGLSALPEWNVAQAAQPALRSLSQISGDMSFLVVRSGLDAVCQDRIAGNFTIQTMTQGVGDRHPLGVGAGGIAILSALSADERCRVLDLISPLLPRYRLTRKILEERANIVAERGYSVDEGSAALNITAIGCVLRSPSGSPMAAIFVASLSDRMNAERRIQIVDVLKQSAKKIERAMQLDGRSSRGAEQTG